MGDRRALGFRRKMREVTTEGGGGGGSESARALECRRESNTVLKTCSKHHSGVGGQSSGQEHDSFLGKDKVMCQNQVKTECKLGTQHAWKYMRVKIGMTD
ncbi:MAG: hypothetical protein ACPIOQ_69915 [Promethearchaeia archaeon]